jgi:CHASE2 domain-containing sensor protein
VEEWLNTRLVVIAATGVSAGVHAGLVDEHLRESRTLGILFALAAAGLAGLAAALAIRPDDRLPAAATAVMFAALLIAYVVLRDEPFDAVAAIAKAAEAVGLVGSAALLRRHRVTRPGDLALAYFGLTFVLAFVVASASTHGGHAHAGVPGT